MYRSLVVTTLVCSLLIAAGMIIVQEAGGQVTDIGGKALDFSAGRKLVRNTGVIGTNGRLHAAILDRTG